MWYACFVSPVTCSAYFFMVPFGLNTLLWEFRGILQEISRYLKFCSFLFLPFGFSYLLMINISGAAGETSCARDMPDACGNEFLDIFLNSSRHFNFP